MLIGHPSFIRNGETVMFHYNNDHSLNTPEVREIIQAYQANTNYNFVVVHYPDSSEIGSLVKYIFDSDSLRIYNTLETSH